MRSDDFLREHGETLRDLLAASYGLTGELQPLPGEIDANLRLTSAAGSALVKVSDDTDALSLQVAAIAHVHTHAADVPAPRTIATLEGASTAQLDGGRSVWLSTWLPGSLMVDRDAVAADTMEQLGAALGRLDRALQSFEDPRARRALKWDLLHAGWIGEHIDAVEAGWLRDYVVEVHEWFLTHKHVLERLRRGAVHNDANDHNVLLGAGPRPAVTGLVDFGDMCHTALVSEVAIAASYAAMHTDDPLAAIDAVTRGFHAALPLEDAEVANLVPLIELRLAVSVVNAAVEAKLRPDDPHVTVSQEGARRVLSALHGRDHSVAAARLRAACSLPPSPTPSRILAHLQAQRGTTPPVLRTRTPLERAVVLDLSFDSLTGGDDPTRFDADVAARRIAEQQARADVDLAIGRYAEPRPIYTDDAFGSGSTYGRRRTVHLGVDVFAPAGTEVTAPLDAIVHEVDVCEGHLDYGGMVTLRHELPSGEAFGTLYGHLDPASIAELVPGQHLQAGDDFAQLGEAANNGGWPPHLHLQLLAADPRALPDVPRGVCCPDDLDAHRTVYPDPSALLGLTDERAVWRDAEGGLAAGREARFAANLKTSYDAPLALVRGWRHLLFDSSGRRYLDAYNNVPHVGHCHPHVARAIAEQTKKLATNTRYLHEGMHRYAERLRRLLPDALEVFFFTPSGSEANELALRLVQRHTGRQDVCVMDHGYHGHTTATMGLSAYKFRQAGAPPQPDWVHVTTQPDVARGEHRGADAAERYARAVSAEIAAVAARRGGVAGYLCECLPSVGGQLELPEGFLRAAYEATRAAGGLCIADDVQTALWRTGEHAFGFERQGVLPDVLVLGKPLGNGFPIGAVVTTRAVAASFSEGPEFFSTFGGSTVAMAAGNAVLDVLEGEGLAENARAVGDQLLGGLKLLQARHPVVGDVRGRGLFLGVELIDPEDGGPAAPAASAIKNALRARRVLIGTDGPHDNVLKIRPPMSFDALAADLLLDELGQALRALS